ncbi:MAG TPA: DinB family protein [Pedobacter sp.]|uniref:DinB family protein n=1 Tax=Pedobacter sp. TaxID=1411316 RepID=UPI002B7D09A6|nr:DinB family protein [Pedobacter sp.]HMI03855.1 DinB family protein [Pedobacter sp.]
MSLLENQYDLIKGSRAAVFRFLEKEVKNDVFIPVAAFNNNTIAATLVHIVNTYLSWAGNFAMKMDRTFYNEQGFSSLTEVKKLFEDADRIIEQFLDKFAEEYEQLVANYKSGNRYVEATILAVFTHMTTHEFHHKGQIMSMCRLLGHTPPDTDIIRF